MESVTGCLRMKWPWGPWTGWCRRGQIGQVGEVIGEESLDAIHAKIEMVRVGRGGNGVGAGLLLSVRSVATAEMNWPEMKGKDSRSSSTKSKW